MIEMIKKNKLLVFILGFLFFIGYISLGNTTSELKIPNEIIFDNPEKEVTIINSNKIYKEKAELDINVRKIKTQNIDLDIDTNNKKVYIKLNKNTLNLENNIGFDKGVILIEDNLENIKSQVYQKTKKNKMVNTNISSNGKYVYKIKDLKDMEGSKIVEVSYLELPEKFYLIMLDNNRNLKKIFVGDSKKAISYSNDIKNYIQVYNPEPLINPNNKETNTSLVTWAKDLSYVDIKLADIVINEITSSALAQQRPGIKIPISDVTVGNSQGVLHIRKKVRIPSEIIPMNISVVEKELMATPILSNNGDIVGTEILEGEVYLRFSLNEVDKLEAGKYSIGNLLKVVTNNSSVDIDLKGFSVTKDNVFNVNKVEIDFWLIGTDFSQEINLLLHPKNNLKGDLEKKSSFQNIRPEYSSLIPSTSSVFDMKGKLLHGNFEETDKIEVVPIVNTSILSQEKGDFSSLQSEWAEIKIPGYDVTTKIWSEYEGLELIIKKTSPLSEATNSKSEFKILHKNLDGKIKQEILVKIYNNYKIIRNEGPNDHKFQINISSKNYNDNNFWTIFNGDFVKKSDVETLFEIKLIGPAKDLKFNFPIFSSGIQMLRKIDNFKYTLNDKNTKIDKLEPIKGDVGVDGVITSIQDGDYNQVRLKFEAYMKKIWVNENLQNKPFVSYREVLTDLYYEYGVGKRKVKIDFIHGLVNQDKILNDSQERNFNIIGIPLISNVTTGTNFILNDKFVQHIQTGALASTNGDSIKGNIGSSPWGDYYVVDYNNRNILTLREEITSDKPSEINAPILIGNSDEYVIYNKYNEGNKIHDAFFGINKWYMKKTNNSLGNGVLSVTVGNELTQTYTVNYNIKTNSFNSQYFLKQGIEKIKKELIFDDNVDTSTVYKVKIGNLEFKKLNLEALRQNSNETPRIILPNEVEIKPQTSTKDSILGKISFSETNINNTRLDMNIININDSGGNGSDIWLHLDTTNFQKLIKNKNESYTTKGKYDTTNIGGEVSESIAMIGLNATTDPDGGTRNESFFVPAINKLELDVKLVKALNGEISYLSDAPLLGSGFRLYIRENEKKYIGNMTDSIDYTRTVKSNFPKYNYQNYRRLFEYKFGKIIGKGTSGSNGSGLNWDIVLGEGEDESIINFSFSSESGSLNGFPKKEFGISEIKKWNYKEVDELLEVKLYQQDGRTLDQFYKIKLYLPQINSLSTYYKKIDIEPGNIIEKEVISTNIGTIIELGEVATKDVNMEITKHNSGNKIDNYGLRIIPGGEILLKDTKDNLKRAEIVFLDDKNEEIEYDINLPNIMVGRNQKAKIGVKLLEKLDSGEIYSFENLDKNNFLKGKVPKVGTYLLSIGRNYHFQEIIPKLILKVPEKISGTVDLKYREGYIPGSIITFDEKGLTSAKDIDVNNLIGHFPIVKKDKNYKVNVMNPVDGTIYGSFTTINGSGEKGISRNDIPIEIKSKSNNILARLGIGFINGNLQINLRYWDTNELNFPIKLEIRDENQVISDFNLNITTIKSFFKIVEGNLNLDFGTIYKGTQDMMKERKAKASIILNTYESGIIKSIEIKNNGFFEMKHQNNVDIIKGVITNIDMQEKVLNSQINTKIDITGVIEEEEILKINQKGGYIGTTELILTIDPGITKIFK
ncbi:MAG: hypothetical protein RR523_04805 [Cetobacterium sp.]